MHFQRLLASCTTFPILPTTPEGVCSCSKGSECKNAGKHPATRWKDLRAGEKVPTPEGYGYGIATGPSGLVVLDEDTPGAFTKVAAEAGFTVPPTLIVASGRPEKGYHYYFKAPTDGPVTSRNVALKLDVKAHGGMVIGPGSKHKSGAVYTVLYDAEPAELPPALLALLRTKPVTDAHGTETPALDVTDPTYARRLDYGRDIIAKERPEWHVPGNGGGKSFFMVVQKLRVGLRLQESDVRVLVEELNRKLPPEHRWENEAEVAHKIAEAAGGRGKIKPDETFTELELFRKPGPATVNMNLARPTADKLGKISLSALAFDLATLPAWQNKGKPCIAFDVFSNARVLHGSPIQGNDLPWSDGTTLRIKQWFEIERSVQPSEELVEQAVTLVSQGNLVNSVGDWLDTLPASRKGIEDLGKTLGLDSAIERKMLRKWLIAACARAYAPGTFVKSALVLYGKQDVGKSTALEILCGKERFGKLRGDLADPKIVGEKLSGKWIVEIEEAHSLSRTDVNAMKGMLSETHDDFRAAYDRHAARRARTCVFAVTTNDAEILDDATGNVRYWCAQTGDIINLDRIQEIREAVWAEARDAFKAGEAWHFTAEEDRIQAAARAETMRIVDAIEDAVLKAVKSGAYTLDEVINKVCITAPNLIPKDGSVSTQRRITKALRRIGCLPERKEGRRGWVFPGYVAEVIPIDRAKEVGK